jgi:hypothetical protein
MTLCFSAQSVHSIMGATQKRLASETSNFIVLFTAGAEVLSLHVPTDGAILVQLITAH